MGTWNSYVWPNLVTKSEDFRLISNGLRGSAFVDVETGRVNYGYQMAGTVLVTVPFSCSLSSSANTSCTAWEGGHQRLGEKATLVL
jgi:ABC-type glycerol-3-phosphate transport system permease component